MQLSSPTDITIPIKPLKDSHINIHQIIQQDLFFKNFDILERALKTMKPVKRQCKSLCDTGINKPKPLVTKPEGFKVKSEQQLNYFASPSKKTNLVKELDNIFEEYYAKDKKCKEKHKMFKDSNDLFSATYTNIKRKEKYNHTTTTTTLLLNQLINDYKSKKHIVSKKAIDKNIFSPSPLLMTSKSDIDIHYQLNPYQKINEKLIEEDKDKEKIKADGSTISLEPLIGKNTRNKSEIYLKHLSEYALNVATALDPHHNHHMNTSAYFLNLEDLAKKDHKIKKEKEKMQLQNDIDQTEQDIKGLNSTIRNILNRPNYFDNNNYMFKRTNSNRHMIDSKQKFNSSHHHHMNLTSTATIDNHSIKSKANNIQESPWMTILSSNNKSKTKIKFGMKHNKQPTNQRFSISHSKKLKDIQSLSPLSDKNHPMNMTMAINNSHFPINKSLIKNNSFNISNTAPPISQNQSYKQPQSNHDNVDDLYSTMKNVSVYDKDKRNMSSDIKQYFNEKHINLDKQFKSKQLFDLISYTKHKMQGTNIRRVLRESYRYKISDKVKERMEALNKVEERIDLFDCNLIKCIITDKVKNGS